MNLDAGTIVNSAALLIIAVMQQLAATRSRRNQKANHKQIVEVSDKADKIVAAVNQPIGLALEALALSRERIAHITESDTDIMSAIEARRRFAAHTEEEALRLKIDAEKQKLIAQFKAEKAPGITSASFLLLLALVLCSAGCANLLAPRTKLSAGPVTWQNPKNMTAEGIKIEYGTNGTMKASIDKISTVMDPQVIAVSGDALAKLVQIAVEAGSAAAAKAAK